MTGDIQILGEIEFLNAVMDSLSLKEEFVQEFETEIKLVILDMYDLHYSNHVSVSKVSDLLLTFLENFFNYEI